jgi:hypothetical protein
LASTCEKDREKENKEEEILVNHVEGGIHGSLEEEEEEEEEEKKK